MIFDLVDFGPFFDFWTSEVGVTICIGAIVTLAIMYFVYEITHRGD